MFCDQTLLLEEYISNNSFIYEPCITSLITDHIENNLRNYSFSFDVISEKHFPVIDVDNKILIVSSFCYKVRWNGINMIVEGGIHFEIPPDITKWKQQNKSFILDVISNIEQDDEGRYVFDVTAAYVDSKSPYFSKATIDDYNKQLAKFKLELKY